MGVPWARVPHRNRQSAAPASFRLAYGGKCHPQRSARRREHERGDRRAVEAAPKSAARQRRAPRAARSRGVRAALSSASRRADSPIGPVASSPSALSPHQPLTRSVHAGLGPGRIGSSAAATSSIGSASIVGVSFAGTVNQNVAPITRPSASRRLSAPIWPPCASTIARQIASPNPMPGLADSFSPRVNFSNKRDSIPAGKPGPLSRTSTLT